MSTTIWIKPCGNEIEMDGNFDPKALKALGWKKKPGPKKQEPVEQVAQKPIDEA